MIEIITLGNLQIIASAENLVLQNRKSQALLVYLAFNRDQRQERAVLAGLFWPELPEAAALNNLSKALGQIRKIFKQAGDGAAPIEATRQSVGMTTAPSWHMDVNQFIHLVELSQASGDPARRAAYQEQAASYYRGEFLTGLSLKDSPEFEEWLLLHRENLMLMARDNYQSLASYFLEQGDFKKAHDYARRQLALDAWHEEAHRQLMRALDGMGRRGEALAQYEKCRQVLRTELGLEPEYATRELYEQIKAGQTITKLPEGAGPGATPSAAQLPKRLLPIVGREQELNALQTDLANPDCRMITIMGPGGVGKTSLALEAARQAAPGFHDGAAFVSLENLEASPTTDLHDLLAAAVGAALEMTFTGKEPIHQQLLRQMRDKDLLLLLDNFEHLLAVPDSSTAPLSSLFVTTLLEQAPGVKVLVTSRERFGVPAEYIVSLEGLPLPDEKSEMPELADYSSIRLFVEQARRIDRNFRLTAANGPAIACICRLVEGLPLGIELAARWVTHFEPAEIAAEIQKNLDFLVAKSPQVQKRHQSISATFVYSWKMLSAGEKRMLARLSIIQSQFDRETGLAVSGGSLANLVQLQGKSLLRQESSGRYSLHQLLRQFASAKLAGQPADSQDALYRRYAAHYLQMLSEQGKGFNQAWTGDAIRQIAYHIEDIRRAWQIAMDMLLFDLIAKALQPLYHYYRIQGLFREAQQIFSQAVGVFMHLHEQDKENRLAQELLGRALLRHGRLTWFLADTEQAMCLLQQGFDHLQQAHAHCDLSRANAYLGEAFLRSGDIKEADLRLNKARDLYNQEGDDHGLATILELQAVCASQDKNFVEADRLYQESITISRCSGNRRLEGRSLHDWGLILLQQGKIEQAAQRFQASQVIARELNLHMPIAFNQSMLARCDRHFGHYDHARRRLSDSWQVLKGSSYAFYTIRALNMQGEVSAILGQTADAGKFLTEALAQLQEMQTAASNIFEYLALDFFIAAAYFFSSIGQEMQASQVLQTVLQHTEPESDLGQRAQQLAGLLHINEAEKGATPGEATTSLSNLLHQIRI